MRALTLAGDPPRLSLADRALPDRPGECRIRVRTAGICGTDLELLRGYAGFSGVPGHEFAGIVEEAPPADAALVGRRVVGEINVGCGSCRFCRLGVREHCETRSVLGIRDRDGAFAEYLTLPATNLHALPDALDDVQAVFVEPTAAACRILEQVAVGPSTRAAVVGDGRMGLLTAQVLRTAGADVVVVGKHDEKLDVARRLGLDAMQTRDARRTSRAFDLVVDVTGHPSGLDLALAMTRPRGTVVMKSTFHGSIDWIPWRAIVDEIALVGSRCGPFAPAIALLASGRVDIGPLVAEVRPLEEFEAAFATARRALKVVLQVTAAAP